MLIKKAGAVVPEGQEEGVPRGLPELIIFGWLRHSW
jgi:hypothetical protein